VRGVVSEDGLTWDVKNEFVIREGGVPGDSAISKPSSSLGGSAGGHGVGFIHHSNPGIYQHIGYPSVAQMPDGTIVASYHEWNKAEEPLQYVRCTRFHLAD
jgi:hypothetical protein